MSQLPRYLHCPQCGQPVVLPALFGNSAWRCRQCYAMFRATEAHDAPPEPPDSTEPACVIETAPPSGRHKPGWLPARARSRAAS